MEPPVQNTSADDLLEMFAPGTVPADRGAVRAIMDADVSTLMETARVLRDNGHGSVISYSRKVFIPLTQLCRDSCHYCTFAHPPRKGEAAYLKPDEVLAIATAGARAGCKEALFTLGDKPEERYRAARNELAGLGHETTISYLAECAQMVFKKTGLLPHLNPGLMNRPEILDLRNVSVSQGIMLESIADRFCREGGPHYGSPDKIPAARLETISIAGEASVAFTTGLLIGIGETREERLESLLSLRALHEEFGHIQGEPTILWEDNQACIAQSKNPVNHKRCKHILIKYHYLRHLTASNIVRLEYIVTKSQIADALTKPLPPSDFSRLSPFIVKPV